MDLNIVVLQISFLLIFTNMGTMGMFENKPSKPDCKRSPVISKNGLRQKFCVNIDLREVPKLSVNFDMLDISLNRIRTLKKSSFEGYSKLKYLKLYENKVQFVEPGAFDHLTSLEGLDLANNALLTIPLELFQISTLRNLWMDGNVLQNLHEDLKTLTKPIIAPLEYLNIADCGLEDIPNLGILPHFKTLNASMNPLQSITVESFATMCHIKTIDLTDSSMPNCACHQIIDYLLHLDVRRHSITCDNFDSSSCQDKVKTIVESEEYQQCSTASLLSATFKQWMFIAGCVGGVSLVLLVVCCCVRRRRRKAKRAKKRKDSVILRKRSLNNNGNTNPDDELLSDSA